MAPNGLEIRGGTPVGEPPGLPSLVSRRRQRPGGAGSVAKHPGRLQRVVGRGGLMPVLGVWQVLIEESIHGASFEVASVTEMLGGNHLEEEGARERRGARGVGPPV